MVRRISGDGRKTCIGTTLVAALFIASCSTQAQAASLPDLLSEALANDAKLASAQAQWRAGLQKEPEARAALLPHISLSQSEFRNAIHVPGQRAAPYSTLGSTVSFNQTLFKWDDWQSYQESRLSVVGAGFALASARQDLILRVTQAYLDALTARDGEQLAREHLKSVGEQLGLPARDVDARTRIVAPVDGEVVGLRLHTIGAAVGPREPVLDLVPAGTPLVVEAKIKPDNVREIVLGGKADVRLTAYNPRTSPVLEGTVAYLSADALADKEARQQFYLARIEISPDAIARANKIAREPIVLGPGLRAEVFIKTRSRSAFDYLFEPVWDGIQKSMRD